MTTVTAVVTCHANPKGLGFVLDMLGAQTRPPDDVLVLHSGDIGDVMRWEDAYPTVRFHCDADRQDWGHHKRRRGLAEARGTWVGFFNDDDSYDPTYLAKLVEAAERDEVDLVYSNWSRFPSGTEPKLGIITSGCFLVRADFARTVGYNHSEYAADGAFVEDLVAAGARVTKVDECLYFHNRQ